MKNNGMGGHQKSIGSSQEWLTDPAIIKSLGEFDLDPCAPIIRPWDMAKVHYTIEDDGLTKPWKNIEFHTTVTNSRWEYFPCVSIINNPRIWLNPPYDRRTIHLWLKKMADHANGITMIFARTETQAFQKWVFEYAYSIMFIAGRCNFFDIYGQPAQTKKGEKANGGAPSVLISYSERDSEAIADSGIKGAHLPVNVQPIVVVGISPSWRSVITIAVNRNNGEACVQTIYSMVEQIAPDKVQSNPNYREKIRQQLQYHFTRISRGRYANKI